MWQQGTGHENKREELYLTITMDEPDDDDLINDYIDDLDEPYESPEAMDEAYFEEAMRMMPVDSATGGVGQNNNREENSDIQPPTPSLINHHTEFGIGDDPREDNQVHEALQTTEEDIHHAIETNQKARERELYTFDR